MDKIRYKLIFNRKGVDLGKEETSLIQVEAYQNGRRKYFTTNTYITKEQWNERHSQIVKHPNAIKLNLSLKEYIRELEEFELSKSLNGSFTLGDFDDYLKQKKHTKTESFIKYCKTEIANRKDLRKSTRVQHEVFIGQVEQFGKINTFSDLTRRNIDQFENWLLEKGLTRSTIYNYHKRMKVYIHRAISAGILPGEADPYKEYKVTRPKYTEIRFLTEDELKAISEKKFPVERLEKIRDMFLFSCYTGMAYKDVVALRHDDIITIGDSKWIRKKREKTDTMYEVLLLPKPLAIIEKYSNNGHETILPSISNAHYNAYLKEIADLCGIRKNLTTHVARHTFATTVMLSNGASLEVVSSTLGHKKLETTRIYGHILDKRIKEEMENVRDRLGKKS